MEVKAYFSTDEELFHFGLVGPIGEATYATDLKKRIQDEIRLDKRFFLLDLSRLKWVNSSMLGVLIAIQKIIIAENGALVLYGTSAKVLQLMRLTDTESVFNRFDTLQEAKQFLDEQAEAA